MPHLEFNLDGIAEMQTSMKISSLDPVIAAGIAELAGVDALGITSVDGQTETVQYIISNSGIPLNWRLPINEKSIESLMAFPPSKVTFIDPYQDNYCMDFRNAPDMKGFFSQVKRGQSRVISVRIESDIKQLKNAYKLGIDQVEINSTTYATASTPEIQIEALEEITEIAQVASKYEMGVTVCGGLNYRNFRALAAIETVDTLVVNRGVLGKAMFIGLENALRDLMFLIR
ncbi:MAG TPA: pyridoxine 5'-phosphate synthase [bacterium]|nr:pyridoxine 5'-phosphate synthase [bacterium]